MVIGLLNNLATSMAEKTLDHNLDRLNKVITELSSGSRINSAADDPAAMSIANGMRANQAALSQSLANTTESIGKLQVASGALSQVSTMLNRAVTLATEASSGILNSEQKSVVDLEYQSILSEIDNIGSTTTYNQMNVFNTAQTTVNFASDSSTPGTTVMDMYFGNLSKAQLGDSGGSVSLVAATSTTPARITYTPGTATDLSASNLLSSANAQSALTGLNAAVSGVAAQSGMVGSEVNTLTAISSVLQTQSENTTAALDAITSTNYAEATSEMANLQVLVQTSIMAIGQDNASQQDLVKLVSQ